MAQIPTDPTKAQVWITKGIDDLDFEFYIPSGPKGDPGGFVDGTELGTTHLNTIVTSGIYKSTTAANVSSVNGYPFSGVTANLIVVRGRTQDIIQTLRPGNGVRAGATIYERASGDTGATWSAWRVYGSQRTDQSVGRVIYGWDEINNREQIIYGDTGGRIISDMVDVANWAPGYTVKLRRSGAQVELRLLGIQAITGKSGSLSLFNTGYVLPGGFQNQHSFAFAIVDNTGAISNGNLSYGGGPLTIVAAAGRSYGVTLSWQTLNSWPLALPGTADGAIPNI